MGLFRTLFLDGAFLRTLAMDERFFRFCSSRPMAATKRFSEKRWCLWSDDNFSPSFAKTGNR